MTAVSWPAWSCTVTVAVPDPLDLAAARAAVQHQLDAMDLAASRFRADSELSRANAMAGTPVRVSPLLSDAVDVALRAARLTDGLVDPTLGRDICALGYDRDIEQVRRSTARATTTRVARSAGWRDVHLQGDRLTVPPDTALDLGATAKALTADRAAAAVAGATYGPALVSVGGDVATVGFAEWDVVLAERPADVADEVVRMYDGGLATSSTLARRWTANGSEQHHLVDPRTRRPAVTPWRTVTVAAATCVDANTASTAAMLLGDEAPAWLEGHGLPARLVDNEGRVARVAGWTREEVAA